MTDPALAHDNRTRRIRLLRLDLAQAHINLRTAHDTHTIARAAAERAAIRRRQATWDVRLHNGSAP